MATRAKTSAATIAAAAMTPAEIEQAAVIQGIKNAEKAERTKAAQKKSAETRAANKVLKDIVARETADKDRAAANSDNLEAIAAREKAILDAASSVYSGFQGSTSLVDQGLVSPPKRRRIADKESAANFFSMKDENLQRLVDISAAIADSAWWEAISDTSTNIVAMKAEDMMPGQWFMVVEEVADRNEVVDDKFFRTSSQIIFEWTGVVGVEGCHMVKYIGATAQEFDDRQLISPVGCTIQQIVLFAVHVPPMIRKIQGGCKAPLYRAGVLERVVEDSDKERRRVNIAQSSHLAPSAIVGGTSVGESTSMI